MSLYCRQGGPKAELSRNFCANPFTRRWISWETGAGCRCTS